MNKVEMNEERNGLRSEEELERIREILRNDREFLEEEEIEHYEQILEENEENKKEEEYYENYEMRKLEREARLQYSYVANLKTEKEKLDTEKILRSNCRKFYNLYSNIRKKVGGLEDLIDIVRINFMEKAQKGILVETLSQFKTFTINCLVDIKRSSEVHYDMEDEKFDMLQQSADEHVVSGEQRLFRESAEARENGMMNDLDKKEFDAIEVVEGFLNSEEFKNLKEDKQIKVKKLIFSKAIHNAGLSSSYFWNQYKAFENELDEEKKEILAEGIAFKEDTGKYEQMTDDIMLKTFMGIRTGSNAGSAGAITRDIPQLLKEIYIKNGGKLYV